MHAAFLAEELEITEVIVPRFPGAFSAWGMLETDLRRDFSRSFYAKASNADLIALAEIFAHARDRGALGAQGRGRAGRGDARRALTRHALRGAGVHADDPESATRSRRGFVDEIAQRFHDAHGARYGHSNPGAPVEFVVARTTLLGELGRAEPERLSPQESPPQPRRRDAVFDRQTSQAAVVHRDELRGGSELAGPAIIDEQTATTVVPPRWTLRVDQIGTLQLTHQGEET